MRTFKKTAAQGDVLFCKVEGTPAALTEVSPADGCIVVTHSETGHHHLMVLDREEAEPNVRMWTGDNPLMAWLQVNRPTVLEHKRDFDTHEPILFQPGCYVVHRQREHTPAGFRQVMD